MRIKLSARVCLAPCLVSLAISLAGCRRDMQDQPKYIPLRPSTFFADGRSERPLVEGTVARGHLQADTAFYTGKIDGKPVETLPVSLLPARCSIAASSATTSTARPATTVWGTDYGMVVRRGYRQPPTLHSDRLRKEFPWDTFTTSLPKGSAPCRITLRRLRPPTVGRLWPTFACCSSARMPPSTTCRRKLARSLRREPNRWRPQPTIPSFVIPDALSGELRSGRNRSLVSWSGRLDSVCHWRLLQRRPVLPLVSLVLHVLHRRDAGLDGAADVAVS